MCLCAALALAEPLFRQVYAATQAFHYNSSMLKYLRRLTPTQEFILVIGIAFGWFIVSSLQGFTEFFSNAPPADPLATDAQDLYRIMRFEAIALLLIATLLRVRDWPLWQVNLQITWRTTLAGVGLAGAALLIYFVALTLVFEPIFPATNVLYPDEVTASLDLTTITGFSILNGFYEEVLVVGYVYLALAARKGFGFTLFTSLTIRLLYHLYQGPIAIISVIPMGILFFYLYARYRRLWPLVLAHSLLDFISLWDEVCLGDNCDNSLFAPME